MDLISTMHEQARGYIASGEFNGFRAAQHVQNQIVRLYCQNNNLKYVLSRAEYWMNGSTQSQLWAALKEGFKHIVFFSVWQLPEACDKRREIYRYCIKNNIHLHFATENMKINSLLESVADVEMLIQTHIMLSSENYQCYLTYLSENL